ncbi:MAG: AAC(3) family N-acetyltransferase [Clostridia bacterium]|nr:AAC(3) family N-acetyltransferase [Clostridia bacterium]
MYSKNDIIGALSSIGAPRGRIVVVHSAFSLVGEVQGGPRGFLDALIEYFTADGGVLCIPTHTWGLLGKTDITLDLGDSYTNLGILAKIAILHESGERSENPTHSMVLFGEKERVNKLVECEKWVNTPTSPDGLFGQVYKEKGKILLIGVSHTSNTYIHFVDEILGTEGRMEKEPLSLKVRRKNGEIIPRIIYMYDETNGDISRRFDKFSTAFSYHGATVYGRIGDAPSILCDAVKIKEVMELIYKRAAGEDILADNNCVLPNLFKEVLKKR